jgi:hypothetical protein
VSQDTYSKEDEQIGTSFNLDRVSLFFGSLRQFFALFFP